VKGTYEDEQIQTDEDEWGSKVTILMIKTLRR